MTYYNQGSGFGVEVSPSEVDDFNDSWPCSTIEGAQFFAFEADGDLIDHEGYGDGAELIALSESAYTWGLKRGGLPK